MHRNLLYNEKDDFPIEMAESHYAFAVPILPGKLEAWKATIEEVRGPKKKEYKASRKKAGISHEHVWLQHTPMGDFVVVSVVGKNPEKMIERFAASKDPFDKWFMARIAEVHGIDANKMPPANEDYLDIL
jgi:hypothetical protein